jgi:hypothetical protein
MCLGREVATREKAILTRLTLSRVCGAANTGSKRIHKKKVA